jgi:hypothetical protein
MISGCGPLILGPAPFISLSRIKVFFFLSCLMTGSDAHACNADYLYMELKLDVISVL